jgi:hypothetical protein
MECLFSLLGLELLAYAEIRAQMSTPDLSPNVNRLNDRFSMFLVAMLQFLGFYASEQDFDMSLRDFLEQGESSEALSYPGLRYVACGVLIMRAIVNHEMATPAFDWSGRYAVETIFKIPHRNAFDIYESDGVLFSLDGQNFAYFWTGIYSLIPMLGSCMPRH